MFKKRASGISKLISRCTLVVYLVMYVYGSLVWEDNSKLGDTMLANVAFPVSAPVPSNFGRKDPGILLHGFTVQL